LVCATDPKLFHARVTTAHVDRAVALVEALLVGAAQRGFVATPGAAHLTLMVEGEPAVLSLKEGTKRVPHVRTQEELEREERRARAAQRQNWDLYRNLYQLEPQWDYHPNGLFTLELDNADYLGIRRRWGDTQHRKLESLLIDVLAGLVAYAAATKQRREQRERREREYARQKQQQEEARQQQRLEKARCAFLAERLDAFDEMIRLERFVGRVLRSRPGPPSPARFQEFV
jgi:hypothetical protein